MATKTAQMFHNLRKPRLPPLPSLRDLLRMYQLTAKKQLSQNFLMDAKLTGKIVKSAGNVSNCVVCEVGPGPGGITRSILERGPTKVILIEKDKRFANFLKMLDDSCPGKVEVFWGDVLSFEMSRLFPEELRKPWDDQIPKIHIIGNLPFNISTPLISRWLSKMSNRESAWAYGRVPMTLTFQKEVAERLTAEAGNEQRSRLSVMAQYLTESSLKFVIKGTAFVPKPEVDVGVVKFVPRKEPLIKQPYRLVEKVVRHVFCFRGQYCCRPISTLFPNMARTAFTKMIFERSLVFPNTRPYSLSMDEFENLCNAYASICEEYPEIYEYEYRQEKADVHFEQFYSAKYEPFRDERIVRPKNIKPLLVISEDLAGDVADEILIEQMIDEEDMFA